MESQWDNPEETIKNVKVMREQIESRKETLHNSQLDLIGSLQSKFPDIVSSLHLCLKVVSSFNSLTFTPMTLSLPHSQTRPENSKPSPEKLTIDESGSPLTVVKSMVAVCLLERVPFTEIDSSSVLSKLENDSSATGSEKAALRELGGILAVEMAGDNGGVQLEEFKVSGKSRVLVKGIDRTRLVNELPESEQFQQNESGRNSNSNSIQQVGGGAIPGPMGGGGDVWGGQGDTHLSVVPHLPFFAGPRGVGPRGIGVGQIRAPMRGGGVNSHIGGGGGGGSNVKPMSLGQRRMILKILRHC